MNRLLKIFMAWVPLGLGLTLVCGVIYGVTQQNYRLTANDPQIQLSEDIAAALANGQAPQDITSVLPVDISKSLQTFVITFDDQGKMTGSNAYINNDQTNQPVPPSGVFAKAKTSGENRFTWQPQAGSRIAAVLTHYSGKNSGYVLIGRNLREVERRELLLAFQVLIAWAVIMVLTFAAVWLQAVFHPHVRE